MCVSGEESFHGTEAPPCSAAARVLCADLLSSWANYDFPKGVGVTEKVDVVLRSFTGVRDDWREGAFGSSV